MRQGARYALALAPPQEARYYTNKVRLRGLMQKQEFETHAGGFCLCSRDF
jgi:hypothetical protein